MDQLAKALRMKFKNPIFQIFWEIYFMRTPTGLQILVYSTYVLHPITIIAVNYYQPSPEWQGRIQPLIQADRELVTQTLRNPGLMQPLLNIPNQFSWQSFAILLKFTQVSKVYPVFCNHRKLRMTKKFGTMLKWICWHHSLNQCPEKLENHRIRRRRAWKFWLCSSLFSHAFMQHPWCF